MSTLKTLLFTFFILSFSACSIKEIQESVADKLNQNPEREKAAEKETVNHEVEKEPTATVQNKKDIQNASNPTVGKNDVSSINLVEISKYRELPPIDQTVLEKEHINFDQLIASFDLDHPGLGTVAALYENNEKSADANALLDYFRTKWSAKAEPINRISEKDQKHADLALKHYFSGNKNYEPSFRGEDIDWFSEAVIDGKTIKDAEWLFQFHRLTWWQSLTRAYAYTKDERYYEEWIHELKDYVHTHFPIDNKKTIWSIRRGMETYYRCLRLIDALPYMIQSPSFGVEELLYSLVFFNHQANHLPTVFADKGNHLIGDLTSSFKNGLAFPEFKDAKRWRDIALKRVPEEMFKNIFDDGMNRELVFSYHTMYFNLFAEFLDLANENGYGDQIPQKYKSLLQKMYKYTIPFTYPDMAFPQVGDGWNNSGYYKKFYRQASERYPDNKAYDAILSYGKKGVYPNALTHNYPESGFYTIRSGWQKEDIFLMLKNGIEAYFHNQIDNGTFTLWAYGRDFMNDSGCYIYNSKDPKEKKLREWFRSSIAHQTLTIDGKNINRVPHFIYADSQDNSDILVVENDSYTGLKHRRSVIFVDKKFFIIHDEAIGPKSGLLEAHFQLAPMPTRMDANKLEISSNNRAGSNIIIQGINDRDRITLIEKEGWISYKYGKKQKRGAWSFQKQKGEKDSGFTTILYPYKKGEKPNSINAKISGDKTLRKIVATIDSKQYEIIFDYERKKFKVRK